MLFTVLMHFINNIVIKTLVRLILAFWRHCLRNHWLNERNAYFSVDLICVLLLMLLLLLCRHHHHPLPIEPFHLLYQNFSKCLHICHPLSFSPSYSVKYLTFAVETVLLNNLWTTLSLAQTIELYGSVDWQIKWIMKVRKVAVRFGVLKAVSIKNMVFWVVTPYSLVDKCRVPKYWLNSDYCLSYSRRTVREELVVLLRWHISLKGEDGDISSLP
jgi:hypothetical protein